MRPGNIFFYVFHESWVEEVSLGISMELCFFFTEGFFFLTPAFSGEEILLIVKDLLITSRIFHKDN